MRQPESDLTGPERATLEDIEAINRLFVDAFTDRYHRDGMTGVRVPFLNPLVWRYAIEDAGEGALVWRDSDGRLAAFNLVHQSGTEGWMGPLAVRPVLQGMGVGTTIVREGIRLLSRRGATVIGLETMPRTVENIGFYSGLGFRPGYLTVSMVKDLATPDPVAGASRLPAGGPARVAALEGCRQLTALTVPGVDYTRELALTEDLEIGGTSLLSRGTELEAFALWHLAAMAQGRPSDEVRIRKLVARDLDAFQQVVAAVERDAAAVPGVLRASVRCQTRFADAYARLLQSGYRVHWTDLRMELWQGAEPPAPGGIVLSNWEI